MSPLFLSPAPVNPADYGQEKVAGIRLQSPAPQWSDEIIQTLVNSHSYIPMEKIVVNFHRRDENTGTAFAIITIQGSPNLLIPVIIKNWEMSPLDIMLEKDATLNEQEIDNSSLSQYLYRPLNERNFTSAMDMDPIGKVVNETNNRSTGWSEDGSALRLPPRGRNVYASVIGATEEKQAELINYLNTDKQAMSGFIYHRTANAVEAWLTTAKTAALKNSIETTIPTPLATAKVTPTISTVKTAEVVGFKTAFDTNGNIVPVSFLKMASIENPEAGVVNVAVYSDNSYSAAPEYINITEDAGTTKTANLHAAETRVGDTVLIPLDYANGIVSAPYKVASITNDMKVTKSIVIKVATDGGRPITLRFIPYVKKAVFSGTEYALPISTPLIRIGGEVETKLANAQEVGEKVVASLNSFIHCNGDATNIKLGELVNASNLNTTQAKELLAAWFGETDLLEQAKVAVAPIYFNSNVEEIETERGLRNEIITKISTAAQALIPFGLSLPAAVKLATWMPEEDSVDSILSLGMMSPENITEFLTCADNFKDCIESLAKLLFYIRIGMGGDETATVVAMKALQRVVEKIDGISGEVLA